MPVGKVIEILGKSGEPEVELLAVIRQYNLPLEFPEDVIAEANLLSAENTKWRITGRICVIFIPLL